MNSDHHITGPQDITKGICKSRGQFTGEQKGNAESLRKSDSSALSLIDSKAHSSHFGASAQQRLLTVAINTAVEKQDRIHHTNQKDMDGAG